MNYAIISIGDKIMETTSTFSISEVGETSGKSYVGEFKVKTVLTRRELFRIDAVRREIIGPSPEGSVVPADLQLEAHMHAHLQIRVIKAPQWWAECGNGLDIEDLDIIAKLFGFMIREENKGKTALKKEAEQALEKLANKPE